MSASNPSPVVHGQRPSDKLARVPTKPGQSNPRTAAEMPSKDARLPASIKK